MLRCCHKTHRRVEYRVGSLHVCSLASDHVLRIRFSGDTQPTNTLVNAGRNATLLIHEATMADDQVDMAKKKAHSTFGQAIDIGRR